MKEILDIITPQTFAMVLSVYLLVRFESTIKNLCESLTGAMGSFSEKIDAKIDALESAISRNNSLLSLFISRQIKGEETKILLDKIMTNGNGEKKNEK